MAIDRIFAHLARVPLLVGLTPDQIEEIGRHTERMKFLSGEVICRIGAAGDGAILIISGMAERIAGPDLKRRAEPVEPGSVLGEMAMLIEHAYGSTVVACDRVLCLKITRSALQGQLLADYRLVEHFERRITERLMRVAEDLRQLEQSAFAPGAAAGRNAMSQPSPAFRPAQLAGRR